jgi:hypothetical protein
MARDPYNQREDERAREDDEARKAEERERLDRLREHMPAQPEVLPIIGRERWLIDSLTMQLRGALRGHATTTPNLEGRRGGSFEVLIHVDDEPTGHVARVTVELDRFDTELAEKYKCEQADL